MAENLLDDNLFILKVKNKEQIKEIALKKYSFSIQLKLMKSGLLNKLTTVNKQFSSKKEIDVANIDWIVLGELLETSTKVIYEMLPDDIKLTKTVEDLLDTMIEGEPIRFMNWIFAQFGKTNHFLAQENPKEVASPQG